MTPEELSKQIEKKASELKNYATTRFPSKAGNIALRFINGNFRAQGFQGNTFKRWKPILLLIKNLKNLKSLMLELML